MDYFFLAEDKKIGVKSTVLNLGGERKRGGERTDSCAEALWGCKIYCSVGEECAMPVFERSGSILVHS